MAMMIIMWLKVDISIVIPVVITKYQQCTKIKIVEAYKRVLHKCYSV